MKLLYLAGPFRDRSLWQMRKHVEQAEQIASELWREGYVVLSPHLNHGAFQGLVEDNMIGCACDLLVNKCDALVRMDGWEHSEGTRQEVNHARDCGLSILRWDHVVRALFDVDTFERWE